MKSPIVLFASLLVLFASMTAAAEPQRVLMQTSLGDITLELDADKAPKTVANFLAYVDDGFYDGTIFHRVIGDFMIQGGGLQPDMEKKATRAPVENEAKNGLKNLRGSIAMARMPDPDSATSQFFINVVDNDYLNHSPTGYGYAVFGHVTAGMDTVNAIANSPTGSLGQFDDLPVEPILITSAKRLP